MKHISHLLIATTCGVLSVTAFAQTPVLLRTFNNPTPGTGDYFGMSLAALGNDRVLIVNEVHGARGATRPILFAVEGDLGIAPPRCAHPDNALAEGLPTPSPPLGEKAGMRG